MKRNSCTGFGKGATNHPPEFPAGAGDDGWSDGGQHSTRARAAGGLGLSQCDPVRATDELAGKATLTPEDIDEQQLRQADYVYI